MRLLCLLCSAGAMTMTVAVLTACGGSAKDMQNTMNASSPGTGGKTTVVILPTSPPSKQEIIKAKACLKQERVRPARNTPDRQQVPYGAYEMTRNGLPMTPQEYEATVRRCVESIKSASASTHRK